MSPATVIDHILSHLLIRVSTGTTIHAQPLDLFHPDLHNYHQTATTTTAKLRAVPSAAARDGYAVVQDKDLLHLWRLPGTVAAYEVFF